MPGRLFRMSAVGLPSRPSAYGVKDVILHITLLQGPIAMERNPLIR
jgi:hypothetical protein